MRPLSRRMLFWTPLILLLIFGAMLNFLYPGNHFQTQRHYHASRQEAHRILYALIPQQKTYGRRWKLIEASPHQLKVEVPVLIFTDDLTINLREDEGRVLIDMVSRSRVGKGDFGENRRHILQLLAALDERLGES